MGRGRCPRSGAPPRHPQVRCRTHRQRRMRGHDGGRVRRWFLQRPRRHRLHRAGPGGSASAACAVEEEQASGRGRDGGCPRRWRTDRCRASDHQAFQQPHTRGLTAGSGDRANPWDRSHRLGVGATGHPGFAASQHSPAESSRRTAGHHGRHASYRACRSDDGPTAEDRGEGPTPRAPGRTALRSRSCPGDTCGQRRCPRPGDDGARFRRTPRRRHNDGEPLADNVDGRSHITGAGVSDRLVHRLIGIAARSYRTRETRQLGAGAGSQRSRWWRRPDRSVPRAR